VDPTSPEFDTEEKVELSGNPGTMVDLINRCLHTEMKRDRGSWFLAKTSPTARAKSLSDLVKGKGGVFKVYCQPSARVRQRPRFQTRHWGSEHCGPGHRHGYARIEAGG